ncbi:MAG TPA: nuclear transport factor 2 family protein [Solirubrobacteraceae bacterium]|jgi:ketosteroid isomerase-like protein
MSRENIEIVRRFDECRSRGDLSGGLDAFHPDVEWEDVRQPELVPKRRGVGVASLHSALEEWAALDGFTTDVEDCFDSGEFVFVISRWRGTTKEGDHTIDVHRAEGYEFANGKIIRVTLGGPDTPVTDVLRAAGLEE